MKKYLLILSLGLASMTPIYGHAIPLNLDIQLKPYRGDGAYLAIYLTNSNGIYQKTLWIAGTRSKYYKHLLDWARGSGKQRSAYDGLTGASLHQGQPLTITVDIDEALIDNGYQLRIDSAVEDGRDNRAEVIVPLTRVGDTHSSTGKGYVQSFSYRFR